MGGALNCSGERFQNNAASLSGFKVSRGRPIRVKKSMQQQKYPDRVDIASRTTDADIENMTFAS